ncbi:hypothetical protein Mgra_00004791, partial [Meloidogyne graminicola]
MFNYYEDILRVYQEQLNTNIEQMNIEQKLRFVMKRLIDYKNLNNNEYEQILQSYGLNIDDVPNVHNNYIPDKLNNIRDTREFDLLLQRLKFITREERNLFYFYKLHLLARTLIKLFILNYSNYYINLLIQFKNVK